MTYQVGDPGHIKAHADLVGTVNTELTRFGLGGLLPIKEQNDEGHLDDHNAIRGALENLETASRRSFVNTLPPVRSLSDPGHTDDHNALAACASEVATWDAWNEATGGIATTVGDYNGTGNRWMIHTFTAGGTLTITRATQPFRYLLVAGGSGANYYPGQYARGGYVIDESTTLSAIAYDVIVGAGGAGGQNNAAPGGVSKLGDLVAMAASPEPQKTSDITGTATPYGGPGNYDMAKGRGGVGYANRGGDGEPGIVVVSYQIG